MAIFNKWSTFSAGSGARTVALVPPPGQGGQAVSPPAYGSSVLCLDHITGYFIVSAITAPAQVTITLSSGDSNTTAFQTRFAVSATSTPVNFNIIFPEGTGPRLDTSNDASGSPPFLNLAVISSSCTITNNAITVGHHHEP